MSEVFLKLVNMSISATWLVLAVLLLRCVLKKGPKWVNVLLWGIVAVRLICPVSIESVLSLIPSGETISPDIMLDPAPTIQTGIPVINSTVNPVISQTFAPDPGASANPLQIWIPVLAWIWAAGVVLMLAYTTISYFRLRGRVKEAVLCRDQIFLCENVPSPFVLGILKPRIYLPYHMDGRNIRHVIAHEQAHIRRRDHWWKPLGFLLLALHWFNPVMWIAYTLLCRDIELACDEKVIRQLGAEQRADYSQALLNCSISRRLIAACPLAFGEVGVKERVKTVLNYKKPGFWIIAAAIVVCAVVAVCFLTNPPGDEALTWAQELAVEDIKQIELVVQPQAEEKEYRLYSGEELEDIVALINQVQGKRVEKPEAINGQSIFFYVTLKNGSVHRVGNIGNVYLMIDDSHFEAAYGWLSAWEAYGEDGNGAVPEGFYDGLREAMGIVSGGNPSDLLPLEELPSNYSLEQAKLDGCVVMEDGDVTSGQEIWLNFYDTVQRGEAAAVRYVKYYNIPANISEELEDDYPCMYVHDLTFDGTAYTVRWYEEGEQIVQTFRYLMRYAGEPESKSATFRYYTRYVLTDDDTVTWEEIWSGMLSSQLGDSINHHSVYTDLVFKDDPTQAELERVKDKLEPYMIDYKIATLDANELTGTLDIEVEEMVEGLEELVSGLIDLKYVRISLLEGELRFVDAGEDRLPVGTYVAADCLYMCPASSYFFIPGDYRYHVTEDSFVTEGCTIQTGMSYTIAVNWQWQEGQAGKGALKFMKDTAFEKLWGDCRYQELESVLFLVENDGTLYLVRKGDTRSTLMTIWSIYVLVPEAEYDPQ